MIFRSKNPDLLKWRYSGKLQLLCQLMILAYSSFFPKSAKFEEGRLIIMVEMASF